MIALVGQLLWVHDAAAFNYHPLANIDDNSVLQLFMDVLMN